jgi:hypothetical protein
VSLYALNGEKKEKKERKRTARKGEKQAAVGNRKKNLYVRGASARIH